MIPNTNMIFGNIFDDSHITTPRIFAFGNNCRNRFISANVSHDYDVIISLLTTTLTNLGNDLGSVDTSLNLQKGKTLNNDDLMALFSSTMSDEESFIAKALGGRLQAFFLEFYPHGISEYTKATKLKNACINQ